jgi:transposase-like protein
MTDVGSAGGKKRFWTEKHDRIVIEGIRDGLAMSAIARKIGCAKNLVQRNAKRLGLTPANPSIRKLDDAENSRKRKPKLPEDPPHLASYKAARRGVVIPRNLEQSYYDLLKKGVSISDALRTIGITPNKEGTS